MKPIKQFKIGSHAFFDGLPDYASKDYDELCILDEFHFKGNSVHANGLHGKDVFFFRNMNKEEFIADTRASVLPMVVGKFLVPEFVEWLGFTIEDLKGLSDIFDKLDKPHSYEKIIFNAYVENNGFYLTEEQRLAAYNEYKKNKEQQ